MRPDEGNVAAVENVVQVAGASGSYGALLVASAGAAKCHGESELIAATDHEHQITMAKSTRATPASLSRIRNRLAVLT